MFGKSSRTVLTFVTGNPGVRRMRLALSYLAALLCLGGVGTASSVAQAKPVVSLKPAKKPRVVKLQFTADFILEQVLLKKNLSYRPEIAKPKLFLESKTKLSYFQEAMLPQWGFKPDVFTNAFAVLKNEVFLSDQAAYYKKYKRCMDDSMAHELTHYVQTKYQNYDLADESLETEAVEIQSWFREVHCKI